MNYIYIYMTSIFNTTITIFLNILNVHVYIIILLIHKYTINREYEWWMMHICCFIAPGTIHMSRQTSIDGEKDNKDNKDNPEAEDTLGTLPTIGATGTSLKVYKANHTSQISNDDTIIRDPY